ncbi:unnamed protein product [Acanthosepion pharaonis]|uniref:Uncharacterized protein n=1 Tax=Acanthosepion pharaonis TaxID=158019 RepID=A0A812CXR7_ACAPH|nr:unnamed protein product [Sepia pharaonis]
MSLSDHTFLAICQAHLGNHDIFYCPSLPRCHASWSLGRSCHFRSFFLTYVSCSLRQSNLFAILLPYLGVILACAIMSLFDPASSSRCHACLRNHFFYRSSFLTYVSCSRHARLGDIVSFRFSFLTYVSCSVGQAGLRLLLLPYLDVMLAWTIKSFYEPYSLPRCHAPLDNHVSFRSSVLTWVPCSFGQSCLFSILLPNLGFMIAWAIMSLFDSPYLPEYHLAWASCSIGQPCLFSILLHSPGLIIDACLRDHVSFLSSFVKKCQALFSLGLSCPYSILLTSKYAMRDARFDDRVSFSILLPSAGSLPNSPLSDQDVFFYHP